MSHPNEIPRRNTAPPGGAPPPSRPSSPVTPVFDPETFNVSFYTNVFYAEKGAAIIKEFVEYGSVEWKRLRERVAKHIEDRDGPGSVTNTMIARALERLGLMTPEEKEAAAEFRKFLHALLDKSAF